MPRCEGLLAARAMLRGCCHRITSPEFLSGRHSFQAELAALRDHRRRTRRRTCGPRSPPIPAASPKFSAAARRPPARLVEMRGRRAHHGAAGRKLAPRPTVEARRDAMFAGEKINITEDRAVLHAALRAPQRRAASWSTAHDVVADVHAVLDAMAAFCRRRPLGQRAAARPARRSPTSSISASAAPISARPWRRWRWRPIMTGRARISSPMSTARISPTR